MFLFEIFQQQSKNEAILQDKILDKSKWPDSWTTIFFKSYPRLDSVVLPKPSLPVGSLGGSLLSRTSSRTLGKVLSANDLSTILFYSLAEKSADTTRRMYPSAGALYPIEAYVIINNVQGITSGLYHYSPHKHTLISLIKERFTDKYLETLSFESHMVNACSTIILTAVFNRTCEKYGERGYRFALLEAGAIMQNVSLISADLRIDHLDVGGIIDGKIEDLLEIDGLEESVVHCICLG